MRVIQSNTEIIFEYDESGNKKYLHRIILGREQGESNGYHVIGREFGGDIF